MTSFSAVVHINPRCRLPQRTTARNKPNPYNTAINAHTQPDSSSGTFSPGQMQRCCAANPPSPAVVPGHLPAASQQTAPVLLATRGSAGSTAVQLAACKQEQQCMSTAYGPCGWAQQYCHCPAFPMLVHRGGRMAVQIAVHMLFVFRQRIL